MLLKVPQFGQTNMYEGGCPLPPTTKIKQGKMPSQRYHAPATTLQISLRHIWETVEDHVSDGQTPSSEPGRGCAAHSPCRLVPRSRSGWVAHKQLISGRSYNQDPPGAPGWGRNQMWAVPGGAQPPGGESWSWQWTSEGVWPRAGQLSLVSSPRVGCVQWHAQHLRREVYIPEGGSGQRPPGPSRAAVCRETAQHRAQVPGWGRWVFSFIHRPLSSPSGSPISTSGESTRSNWQHRSLRRGHASTLLDLEDTQMGAF